LSCDLTSNDFTLTKMFILGPDGSTMTETDGSGNWQHTDVPAGPGAMATYDAAGLHFSFSDWLGTRRVQTDYTGTVETSFQGLPFGEILGSFSGDATEKHFTGKEHDTESGNDYFNARYYASSTGRFMIPDWSAKVEPVPYAKLGDPQSLNLYSYVHNNPLRLVDADGHDFWDKIHNLAHGKGFHDTPGPGPGLTAASKPPADVYDSYKPEGGGGKTIKAIASIVYKETRPMSDSPKANEPITTARERIADVYLNGNHDMAPPGKVTQNNSQEQAAYTSSLDATRHAVLSGTDITNGATKYNQSPSDHMGTNGGGDFCPHGCPIQSSSGPYSNANPNNNERYINIYP
jgi:RHS repeat-associated protein